ncbi:TrlF family AAA-like ATPase [Chryseolinea lacunae]|uniref:AAA family ATPase n=1 Tax=Chryseolinea lacunae TaxID=2801331 RepID=A0ABS1L2E6_9BACT|nr:AAA family ATPase [Chryseolinea lacunae]MBL0745712.1 AAA family ATPase [Chryseolinea lacunae]
MKGLIHGAKWWKFDFHNHTPKSNDFGKGDAIHMAITPENWLLMYMNAGIDCVAITDHNSGEWIDILKAALAAMEIAQPVGYRKLYLFPGVEISATGNIHILALFDPSAGTADIQTLLGNVRFPAPHIGTTDAVSPDSVEDIIKAIHSVGAVAIPAHVDKPCGLFLLTGFTLSQAIKSEGLLAIEIIDKTAAKPDIYIQSKLHLAEVVGTDSHIAAQVGTNYTWVKMSEPSLDALKLALHDREDGIIRKDSISTDPNTLSNRYFIKSLSVTNGFKAGNGTPLKTVFSPWLTSVIGGRGSGKSTILNYLRIALARIDEMPDEVQVEFDKFNQVGRRGGTGMLKAGTIIEVEIYKDGKLHLITWSNLSHSLQEWNETTASWDTSKAVSNIKELFPVQIFNQKELYALTGNPSKLIELIDSQFDKPAWTEAKDKLVEKWIADRATRRQLIKAISEEGNITAQLGSTNNKIALYESSTYRDTLSNFNKLTEVNKFFTDTNESVLRFISQIEELERSVPSIHVPEAIKDVVIDTSLEFIQAINAALAAVKVNLTEAITLLAPYKVNLPNQFNALPWFQQFVAAKQAYDGIAESIKELGSEPYELLIQRKASLSDKLALISTQKVQLETLKSEIQTLYSAIVDKEKELRIKRKEIIGRWKTIDNTTNPFLIIELQTMADSENADLTFRQLLRKPGGEFSNNIYAYNEEDETSWGLIADIVKEPEATRWGKRYSSLVAFISATEADKKALDLRLAKHLDYLKQNTPEDIDRLMVWFPEDKLVLKFRKEGVEEDIQTGSAGERTAGMLGLLLALNDIPLIIDQPEDDLDTKLISKFVVDGFKKLKQSRQLLIVTHNPNIAVNANSDNVVHMDFVTGQVVVSANNALQDKQIRNAVCEVMEGGRDALNKRYYRISQALKP